MRTWIVMVALAWPVVADASPTAAQLTVPARPVSAAETMDLCRQAAIASADRHGVPRDVMLAITTVETRTRRDGLSGPWPWTVNVEGKGDWFDTPGAALKHAKSALRAGRTSFDSGCFQLNYRWHGEHFASVADMFDPMLSGDYAARFLRSLYGESGDWLVAAGHYHSRTPRHATRYRSHIVQAMRTVDPDSVPDVAPARAHRLPSGNTAMAAVRRGASTWPTRAADAADRPPIAAGGLALSAFARRTRGPLIGWQPPK